MVISLLCVISGVAVAQFALFYWRATVAVTAAHFPSDGLCKAAGIQDGAPTGDHFFSVLRLHEICPDLKASDPGIDLVWCYYQLLGQVRRVIPGSLGRWAVAEMATCTRYVAARIDKRIAHNRAFLAQVAQVQNS